MKRKLITALVIICVLSFLAMPFGASAADDVTFLAVNDVVVELSVAFPYIYSNTFYIPYTVFTTYFGISYTVFEESNTLAMYTGANKQLYFSLDNGTSSDSRGTSYTVGAIYRNGQIYVPAYFICSYFDVSYSFVTGEGYGNLLRLCDSSAIISDRDFITAARFILQSRYQEYTSSISSPGDTQTKPGGSGTNEGREDTEVYISFEGMPDNALLTQLSRHDISSCFFVTSDEVLENPKMLRSIVAEGHTIGVLCTGGDPYEEYVYTSDLIYEAAQIRTLLIAAGPGNEDSCIAAAGEHSLVYWSAGDRGLFSPDSFTLSSVTSLLFSANRRVDLRFSSALSGDTGLENCLRYIITNNYSLRPIREIENEAAA